MKAYKKGDIVVMHTCYESTMPEYKGKLWTCTTDSYMANGNELVFLEGFSGCFDCDFLKKVKTPAIKKVFKQSSIQSRWDHCIAYFGFFKNSSDITVDELKLLHQLLGKAITEKEKKGGRP